jgi:hypothetical protein
VRNQESHLHTDCMHPEHSKAQLFVPGGPVHTRDEYWKEEELWIPRVIGGVLWPKSLMIRIFMLSNARYVLLIRRSEFSTLVFVRLLPRPREEETAGLA